MVVLPDFFASRSMGYVDFVKIDTDGEDLLIVASLDEAFDDMSLLGLAVEVNFFGSARDTDVGRQPG